MSLNSKALATFLGVSLLGCNQASDEIPQPPPVEVVVAAPIKKQIVEWDEYVGRLDAVDFVEVRARVSGYLQSIHFVEGQVVNKGDLLCIIDPRPFERELNRAKAQLQEAQAQHQQSLTAIDTAKATKVRTEASLVYARQRLNRTTNLLPKGAASEDDLEMHRSALQRGEADVLRVRPG